MNKFIISGEVAKISEWDRAEKVYFRYTINTEKYSIEVVAMCEYGSDKHDRLRNIREGQNVIVEGAVTSKQYNGKLYPSLFANSVEILGGGKKGSGGKKLELEDIPY